RKPMKERSDLLIKPHKDHGIYHKVTPESAQWNYLSFGAREMAKGEEWEHSTGAHEMVIVLLGGNYRVEGNHGSWETKNGRKDVFSGVAHTLYFPRNSSFTLRATSNILDIAYGWCIADEDYPAQFVRP